MSPESRLDCAAVDELDAAVALDAVSADERRAVVEHLETCQRLHTELRTLLGVGLMLASALEPVEPSPRLRERVMASVAATAQEHRRSTAAPEAPMAPDAPRRGWLDWLTPGVARGVAAAGFAAALILAVWNVGLQAQVSEAERIRAAIADARAVYPVTGEAGQGLLLDTPEGPLFLAARLEDPPVGSLYELWLIDAEGNPVDAGIIVETDEVALVPLEGELADFATFAMTVEEERVPAPTGTPVMVASIGQ
jgi:anti-sigma-K factor RskA